MASPFNSMICLTKEVKFLPRNQSLTHHDITAGFHSGDDSNLLYHIVNDLRKKVKTPSDCDYKATEGYSLKKREAAVDRLR